MFVEEAFSGENKWLWKFIWDPRVPNKQKVLLWLALEKKILTWDNGLKKGWVGPKKCPLCKTNPKFVQHLFTQHSYALQVWMEVDKE